MKYPKQFWLSCNDLPFLPEKILSVTYMTKEAMHYILEIYNKL